MFRKILKIFDLNSAISEKKLEYIKIKNKINSDIKKKEEEYKETEKKVSNSRKELLKILSTTITEKENIYNSIRDFKIQNNLLISLDSIEIKINPIEKEHKSFLSKIPIINIFFKGNEKVEQYFNIFYYGFNEIKILKSKLDYLNSLSIEKKELHFFKKPTNQYIYNGLPVLHINKDTIFNPEFEPDKNNFIYDIEPEWSYSYINNVVKWKLTNPLNTDSGLMNIIKKYWLLILIMFGLIWYFESTKKTEPFIIPFYFIQHKLRGFLNGKK